jgi:hypothetical protein
MHACLFPTCMNVFPPPPPLPLNECVPAPSLNVQSNSEGLDLVVEAIAKAGYTGKVVIGMDVAASEFYTEDKVRSDARCGVMGCGFRLFHAAAPHPCPLPCSMDAGAARY